MYHENIFVNALLGDMVYYKPCIPYGSFLWFAPHSLMN